MKLLRIGQVAREVGLSVQTIRFYEAKDLIRTHYRAANGYRYFHPSTVPTLKLINHYKRLDFTLKEIEKLIVYYHDFEKHQQEIAEFLSDKIEIVTKKAAELEATRKQLEKELQLLQDSPKLLEQSILQAQ